MRPLLATSVPLKEILFRSMSWRSRLSADPTESQGVVKVFDMRCLLFPVHATCRAGKAPSRPTFGRRTAAARLVFGSCTALPRALFHRHRVRCHTAGRTRTQPAPAARVAGSPKRMELGDVRPLEAPGNELVPEVTHGHAGPSA